MLDKRIIGKTVEAVSRVFIRRGVNGEIDYRRVVFTDGSAVVVKVAVDAGGGGIYTPPKRVAAPGKETAPIR